MSTQECTPPARLVLKGNCPEVIDVMSWDRYDYFHCLPLVLHISPSRAKRQYVPCFWKYLLLGLVMSLQNVLWIKGLKKKRNKKRRGIEHNSEAGQYSWSESTTMGLRLAQPSKCWSYQWEILSLMLQSSIKRPQLAKRALGWYSFSSFRAVLGMCLLADVTELTANVQKVHVNLITGDILVCFVNGGYLW